MSVAGKRRYRPLKNPDTPPSAPGRLAYYLAFKSSAACASDAAQLRDLHRDLPFATTTRVLRHLSDIAEKEYSAKAVGNTLERIAFFMEIGFVPIAAQRWLEYKMVASRHSGIRAMAEWREIRREKPHRKSG
jgi:hypothetical protein